MQRKVRDTFFFANRLRGRDGEVFRGLYLRYGPLVRALAQKILRDQSRAEDVVQDIFVKTWATPEHYDAYLGAFGTWLYASVRNRCVDLLRRRRSQARVLYKLNPCAGSFSQWNDANEASDSETIGRLRTCLRSLPLVQRRVVELVYFEDLTMPQVARQLSIPLGTIKTRKQKAISSLRSAMRKTTISAGALTRFQLEKDSFGVKGND